MVENISRKEAIDFTRMLNQKHRMANNGFIGDVLATVVMRVTQEQYHK